MYFQEYFKPSHRYIEREMESSAKTKASTPLLILRHRFTLRLWYNLHLYVLFAKGEKVVNKGLYFIPSIRFWRFMPKGEKVWPKAKGPHHHPNFKINDFQLVNFKLVSPCVLKGEKVVFSKLIS
jgi:hypothetical protein